MMNQRISLIIPAYNEEKYLAECLDHALKNSNGRFHEIIVVDNASTDKTMEVALSYTKKHPSLRVVKETQKGLTKARQRGFMEATGDILAYTDADTHQPAGWYDKVITEFNKNPNLACLSGPYIYHDIPKWQQSAVKLYWYVLAVPTYILVGYMVVGGNFAIHRKALDKMNGFDTTISFYGEDTNIARRASKFGKVKFSPKFMMYTSGRRLTGQGAFKTMILYVSNFLSEALLHKPITKEYSDIR